MDCVHKIISFSYEYKPVQVWEIEIYNLLQFHQYVLMCLASMSVMPPYIASLAIK